MEKTKAIKILDGLIDDRSDGYELEAWETIKALLERSDNSDYAVTASPKLPSLDEVYNYMDATDDLDQVRILSIYNVIKKLGNFA